MKLPWSETVPMLSINPEAATIGDIRRLADDLIDCRHALYRIANDPWPPETEPAKVIARMQELARKALETTP